MRFSTSPTASTSPTQLCGRPRLVRGAVVGMRTDTPSSRVATTAFAPVAIASPDGLAGVPTSSCAAADATSEDAWVAVMSPDTVVVALACARPVADTAAAAAVVVVAPVGIMIGATPAEGAAVGVASAPSGCCNDTKKGVSSKRMRHCWTSRSPLLATPASVTQALYMLPVILSLQAH